MVVRSIPDLWGATGRLHGPYWLWASHDKQPIKPEPEGEVKINFDYQGYLPSPILITLAVLDHGATAFLEGFVGGELLVASNTYERGFVFMRVPPATRRSPTRFGLMVQEYEQLRPIPDAFEWPRPVPPPPSDKEIEAARLEEFERKTRLIMSDPGMAPIECGRSAGRRVRRSTSSR